MEKEFRHDILPICPECSNKLSCRYDDDIGVYWVCISEDCNLSEFDDAERASWTGQTGSENRQV